MAKLYCTATNTGKGFITHAEQENINNPLTPISYPSNVWQVEDNTTGQAWITRVNGVSKTKAEAQTLVNTVVTQSQSDWDALPSDSFEKQNNILRPEAITITE